MGHSRLDRVANAFSFRAFLESSLTLAAFHIEINSPKARGVSGRTRPIYFGQTFSHLLVRLLAVLERQQLVLPEPGVRVECSAKRIEAVIREHNEQRTLISFIESRSKQLIASGIMLLDKPGKVARQVRLIPGMFGIAEAPEHVLHAVGRVVEQEEKAFLEAIQFEA